jgi:hypothetical protein
MKGSHMEAADIYIRGCETVEESKEESEMLVEEYFKGFVTIARAKKEKGVESIK